MFSSYLLYGEEKQEFINEECLSEDILISPYAEPLVSPYAEPPVLEAVVNTSDVFSEYIRVSKYAKWNYKEERRETWSESIERYINFIRRTCEKKGYTLSDDLTEALFNTIYNREVMPAMRALVSAGTALEEENITGYNCSCLFITNKDKFSELLYISMCGAGTGFSIERQFIALLPSIPENMTRAPLVIPIDLDERIRLELERISEEKNITLDEAKDYTLLIDDIIVVGDSKLGWAYAFRFLINSLYEGYPLNWDMRHVRPKGSPLKKFGGRASGPEPLVDLFDFTTRLFISISQDNERINKKLVSKECYTLCCYVAKVVVSGGVRRSALLSLSNPSDRRMATAKTGMWYITNPEYSMANNSVCYTEKPDMGTFMKEWLNLYESKSGERGIFYRGAAKAVAARNGRRNPNYEFGCNPCSEVILRDCEFCNLTECVIKAYDTEETLMRKIEYATILGTIQATWTDFKFLSPEWKKNCEEEALLGVSLTGIFDNPLTYVLGEELNGLLTRLRKRAIDVNLIWSGRLGIAQSAAITLVKPSGTVSLLCNTAPGIHPRWAKFYKRRTRLPFFDPLAQYMIKLGFPHEMDLMNDKDVVFTFAIKAPDVCVTRKELDTMYHLNLWLTYQTYYCEHKPSVTINIRESEWMDVGAWVYKNFNDVSGIAFMPYDMGTYRQAPYEEITEEEYNELLTQIPQYVNWTDLAQYETASNVFIMPTLACSAGGGCDCE